MKITCKYCGGDHLTKRGFLKHANGDITQRYKCKTCSKSFQIPISSTSNTKEEKLEAKRKESYTITSNPNFNPNILEQLSKALRKFNDFYCIRFPNERRKPVAKTLEELFQILGKYKDTHYICVDHQGSFFLAPKQKSS